MGFWSKLGKIALTAAPYVAAPFTGGASLYAAPATNAAVKAWNAKDAQKNAAKGLAPSKFDQYVGLAGDVAGMANSFGAFKGLSGKPSISKGGTGVAMSSVGKGTGSSWQDTLGKVAQSATAAAPLIAMMGRGGSNQSSTGAPEFATSTGRTSGSAVNRGTNQFTRGLGPIMGAEDQSNPNLSNMFNAGRMTAIKNQPFRMGYDITIPGPEPANDEEGNAPTIATYRMPKIYPTGGRGRRAYGY